MKVTVYQRGPEGWQQTTEYYNWSALFREEGPLWVSCPGCGRETHRNQFQDHYCAGTLTDAPVEPRRPKHSQYIKTRSLTRKNRVQKG